MTKIDENQQKSLQNRHDFGSDFSAWVRFSALVTYTPQGISQPKKVRLTPFLKRFEAKIMTELMASKRSHRYLSVAPQSTKRADPGATDFFKFRHFST